MTVRARGAEELAESLGRLSGDLEDLDAAGARAGRVVAVNARRRAPVASGALAGSIRVEVDDHGANVTVTAGNGRVVYAGVQEGGWPRRNIRANWYMRNALRAEAGQVVDEYSDDVTKKTNKVRGM